MNIYVDTAFLNQKINTLNDEIQNLSRLVSEAKNIVNSDYQAIWKDDHYKAFNAKMQEFLDTLNTGSKSLTNALDGYTKFLIGYASAYEKLEANYQSNDIKIK